MWADITTMTDTYSDHGWIFEALERLRADMNAQHVRMRDDMNAGLSNIRAELQVQNGRVQKTETRLTVIETEREGEKSQALKRGTWAGLLAAGGVTLGVEWVKRMWRP